MRKFWDIPGGVHPPENKAQSTGEPIGRLPLPETLILPLSQHMGKEARPLVEVGQRVLKGQCIAEAQGAISADVHASTSGVVSAIEMRPVSHPSGMDAPCIIIDVDGDDTWVAREECEDYLALDKATLREKIKAAGITGLGGAGFPTAVKMNPRSHKIHTLILNGTECEPYITADDVLMRERADEVVAGALIFARTLNEPEKILVGIEDNKPEAIAAMRKAAEGTRVEIIDFPTKYPSGGERQLIQILTNQEVPSGGIPADIDMVVQNVGTAAAAYRAVRFGEPLIQRVMTVVGEALDSQRNVDVLLGTSLDHVLAHHGFHAEMCARLIIGGPMMGYTLERSDVPVIKTTNCILVPSPQEMPEALPAQPCIRCGMCAEACPASLLPQQLFWYAQAEDYDKLEAHNLFDCIECGACSYVCPSNIPLVQYYRASKGTIWQMESAKEKSDRARERFEARKERLARAEAEKEAKRLARKKAAEKTRRLLAEEKPKPAAAPPAPAPAEALSVQRAKLERAIDSAQNSVQHAREQLAKEENEGDQPRIDASKARLKQTELKLDEARAKLAAFDKGGEAVGETAIKEKLTMSPREKQEKTLATLRKRLATAEEKYREAKQAGAATQNALQQGVEKLREKLNAAEKELATLSDTPAGQTPPDTSTMSAAEAAISKAKAKAAAQAAMSDEEKAQAQIASLRDRLEKARARLAKAEAENSEHVDAFKNSVAKLEAKLHEAQQP